MRAFLYLRWRQLINAIRSVFSDPKQLVVALFFAAWIGINLVLGAAGGFGMATSRQLPQLDIPQQFLHLAAIAVVLLVTLTAIERGLNGAALSFSPGDYDVLFASPVPKRLVIVSRILWDAVVVAFWTGVFVFFLVLFSPVKITPAQSSVHWAFRLWAAAALYAIFVVNLGRVLQLVVAGGKTFLGMAKGSIRIGIWVVALIMVGAVIYAFVSGDIHPTALAEVVRQPPLSFLLLPATIVASIFVGSSPPLTGIAGGLLLVGLLAAATTTAVCVLDRDVIEATIQHSLRKARMRDALRDHDIQRVRGERLAEGTARYHSFLPDWHNPAFSTFYKSLAQMRKGGALRYGLLLLLAIGAAPLAMVLPHTELLRYAPAFVIAYLILAAAGVQSLHLRGELQHFSLLRSLPVPGWQLMVGLVAPRAIVHSMLVLIAIVAFHLGHPIARPDLTAAVAVVVPVAFITAYIAAAITTLLFPRGDDPVQRFLAGLLLLIGLGVALTPAGIVVGTAMVFEISGTIAGLLATAAILPIAALLLLVATYTFERHQPEDD